MSPQFEELKEKIENKKVKLCIIGLGQVGLPTALSFANSGFSVTGVDINEELVSKINNGIPPFEEENLPRTLVWKYAAKARDFIRLYDKEIDTKTIINVRKLYKSHRRAFKTTEAGVDNFKAVDWTKLNVVVAFNGFQQ